MKDKIEIKNTVSIDGVTSEVREVISINGFRAVILKDNPPEIEAELLEINEYIQTLNYSLIDTPQYKNITNELRSRQTPDSDIEHFFIDVTRIPNEWKRVKLAQSQSKNKQDKFNINTIQNKLIETANIIDFIEKESGLVAISNNNDDSCKTDLDDLKKSLYTLSNHLDIDIFLGVGKSFDVCHAIKRAIPKQKNLKSYARGRVINLLSDLINHSPML